MRKIDVESERLYENSKLHNEDTRAAQDKFYWATDLPSREHDRKVLELIRGKRVLEIGCSTGDKAVEYGPASASFVGVDVADEAIGKANQRGIPHATFRACDAHVLPFADASFDAVVVNGLLHHLDIRVALEEIARVLAPRGLLLFREPLGTNPLFQLYRMATPASRTVDERPLTLEDISAMRELFDLSDVQWFGFTSIGSAFVRSPGLRRALTRFDAMLSKGAARYLFWQFSGVATKRA